MKHILALPLLLALASCPQPPPVTPTPPAPPLDEKLAAGQARCGLVTRTNELIGGPGAYLEVGKGWRCYNSKVRFGGGNRDAAVGLALYGGSLLDADVMRDDESADGEDQFRELFPAPGFLGVRVDNVEVVSSGEDGGDAIIRVTGKSAPLGVLPQILLIQNIYDGDVVTDFIMHPDVSHLEMTTTVINNGANAVQMVLGDFFAMGSGLRAFTPETGFGEAPLFSDVSIYAGTSPRVSYAYTVKSGPFTIPVVDAGGTGALVKTDVTLTSTETYTRFLAVGHGSLANVLAEAYRIREQPLGTLHVSLTQHGQPVGGTVTLYRAGDLSHAVNQLLVDASGSVEESVLAGDYVLKAAADGSAVVTSSTITVGAGAAAQASLATDAMATITFTAHELDAADADLGPIPAKLSVVPLQAPAVDTDLRPAPYRGLTTYVPAADGHLVARVPPGQYRFLVSRGPEYELFTHEATLADGDTLTQDVPLHRVLPTPGLLAAEFHQHTLGSLDSSTDLLTKVIENAAEGVELAAATDHDNVKDYAPYIARAGLTPFLVGWAGNEISYNGVGHFNAYPMPLSDDAPFKDVGARLWAGRSVAGLFQWLRSLATDPVIHVSHPRGTNGKGYFAQIKLNPVNGDVIGQTGEVLTMVPEGTLTTLAQDFDAIEVNGELADAALLEPANDDAMSRAAQNRPTDIPTMVDWFSLLSSGHHVAALGNSDSHSFNDGSGWPRNLIAVPDDRPQAVTVEDVRSSIRNQRVLVSNGLLVTPRVGGTVHLGRQDLVAVSGDSVTVELTLESAAWLGGASSLVVFVNGRPLHLMANGSHLTPDATAPGTTTLVPACDARLCRNVITVDIPVTSDAWVVFAARGSGTPNPVGPGSVYGYTNPVYLDHGANGWNP